MSLINSMLQDLEERQALAGIRDDKVLRDLYATREHAVPGFSGRAMPPVFLLMAGLLVCYLGYDFYTSKSVPISTPVPGSSVLMERISGNDPPRPAATAAVAPAGDSQSGTADIKLKFTSLKMDTSAFKTVVPPVAANAVSGDPVISRAEVTETQLPVAAPLTAANRLLHISLTDLAGGSAIQVNTTSRPDYNLFLLKKPDRLLVEIKGLEMPVEIVKAAYKSAAVAGLRYGSRGNTGLLIFDLSRSVDINSTDVREIPGGGYSLDIELLDAGASAVAAFAPVAQFKTTGATGADTASETVSDAETLHQTFQKNSAANSDTRLIDDAMRAYHSGDAERAIDLLYQLLKQDPQQIQARATLATMLIQQQDRPGAVQILSEGLRRHPGNADLIKLNAKLLFDDGRLDQALAWLRQAGPDITTDPDYYALMAAVLQRLKDYTNAGELYSKLVAIRPANGVWWMGLGISLEGIGRSAEALQAYGKARKDRSLAQDLARYIDARIKSLGG